MSEKAKSLTKQSPKVGQQVEIYLAGMGWRLAEVTLVDVGGFRASPYRGFSLRLEFDEDVWRWPIIAGIVEGAA